MNNSWIFRLLARSGGFQFVEMLKKEDKHF